MGSVVGDIVGSITGSKGVSNAANAAAEQQRQAGITSANAAAFRPVGMTTRFGTSQFTREIDPVTGIPYISGASYNVSPELRAIQDKLFAQAGAYDPTQLAQAAQPLYGGASQAFAGANQVLGTAGTAFGGGQNLFGLGGQYLAQSPEQARQEYMATQQAALAPGQEQQLANIRNQLFQTGRSGLATGGTTAGGLQATNPELAAYYNSIANTNRQLAAGAEQAAQQRQAFGAGLQTQGLGMFGTGANLLSSGTGLYGQGGALLGQIPALTTSAYSPLQTQLGLAGTLESMGQQPYQLGLQLGQAQVPGQTAGAQMYNQGQIQGAQTQYQGALQAQQMNNSFLNSLIGSAGMAAAGGAFGGGGALSGLFGGGATGNFTMPTFGGAGPASYMASAGLNPGVF